MGTRGFYAYRFHGRYYIFYRHFDCYLEGLGVWIVQSIPQDSEEYRGERLHHDCSVGNLLMENMFRIVESSESKIHQMGAGPRGEDTVHPKR